MSWTTLRECAAEFLGTFILIMFGVGVVAQVVLSGRTAGDYFSINVGWGLAVTMGVYVAAGVSGAHLNPAVTLALAVKRGFPWAKVAPYMIAQVVGCFLGALGVWLAYHDGLVAAGMPNVWCTGPGSVFGAATFGAPMPEAMVASKTA